ncbi:MAG: methionine--tRNA ligase [Opitutales bacterium]|jgi:methionyl-tRNA synthetase
MAKSRFYLTTAIDYANGAPHLGHAYEKVLADVIARHQRLRGKDVHFLTGLDEHGQKVQQTAERAKQDPQAHCDGVAVLFREMLSLLGISNDDYIRTTEVRHKAVVQRLLQQLFDAGLIYRAEYTGHYSVRQEQFLLEKERLPDGTWPAIYGEVTQITEANYFFRLTQFQPWLVEHLKSHPDFIHPRFRQNQVVEFLKDPVNDLCISRPKSRLSWGIELPFDKDYVTYVWFDALTNYYSAVADKGRWPADLHIIGKDILVPPHAVYWPCMLKALGLEPPRKLLVHGWWNIAGAKASKSSGNASDTLDLARRHGADAFRYFLIREMTVGQDSEFTVDQFNLRYRTDLGNDLGNLLNRLLNMTGRYAGGVVPAAGSDEEPERALRALWSTTATKYLALSEDYQLKESLEELWIFIRALNAYIEGRAPWKLGKSADAADRARLESCLAHIAEGLRLAATALAPVMPTISARLLGDLGLPAATTFEGALTWSEAAKGSKLAAQDILFPPIEPPAAPAS